MARGEDGGAVHGVGMVLRVPPQYLRGCSVSVSVSVSVLTALEKREDAEGAKKKLTTTSVKRIKSLWRCQGAWFALFSAQASRWCLFGWSCGSAIAF